jgi:hypothetical protein
MHAMAKLALFCLPRFASIKRQAVVRAQEDILRHCDGTQADWFREPDSRIRNSAQGRQLPVERPAALTRLPSEAALAQTSTAR